jgi:hypothetical protein
MYVRMTAWTTLSEKSLIGHPMKDWRSVYTVLPVGELSESCGGLTKPPVPWTLHSPSQTQIKLPPFYLRSPLVGSLQREVTNINVQYIFCMLINIRLFSFVLFLIFCLPFSRCKGLLLLLIILSHTTIGRTPLDKWSAHRRNLYLTTHTILSRDRHPFCGGIRTRNASKRAAGDPRGHCYRHFHTWALKLNS